MAIHIRDQPIESLLCINWNGKPPIRLLWSAYFVSGIYECILLHEELYNTRVSTLRGQSKGIVTVLARERVSEKVKAFPIYSWTEMYSLLMAYSRWGLPRSEFRHLLWQLTDVSLLGDDRYSKPSWVPYIHPICRELKSFTHSIVCIFTLFCESIKTRLFFRRSITISKYPFAEDMIRAVLPL